MSFPRKLGIGSQIEFSTPKTDQKTDQNGTLEELASEALEQVTTGSPGERFQRLPLGLSDAFSEIWVYRS